MFKRITTEDYTITPYQANKRFVLDESSEYISTYLGVKYPVNNYFYEDTAFRNDGDGPTYRNVYDLINHFYYRSNEPFQKFGIENRDEINLNKFPEDSLSSISVMKVSRQLFGEKIYPGSFQASFEFINDETVSFEVSDDGKGNVFIDDRQVGNIFYANGVIVLFWKEIYDKEGGDTIPVERFEKDDITFEDDGDLLKQVPDFEYLFTFFNFDVEFRSVVTRYEHEVSCTIDPGEFNGVTNPSIRIGDNEVVDYYKGEVEDDEGNKIDFSPFITTVGLYDEFLNLVAVGKLSRPIKKPDDLPLTIVVEFDT